MKLHLIGVNHKTAPVEVRERLAIPEWRLEEATRRLLEEHGVSECVVFSTCNRVELVTCSDDGAESCLPISKPISEPGLDDCRRAADSRTGEAFIRHS